MASPIPGPSFAIVIPCRLGSKRFPGKAMVKIQEKPLIHWVYGRALTTGASHVVIATAEQEIVQYCEESGLNYVRTSSDHHTGTHRCAEALSKLKLDATIEIVLNWQGDEPLVNPNDISDLVALMLRERCKIATLTGPISANQVKDENVVKVVESKGVAHWFSRAPLRGARAHCGIYAFTSPVLSSLGQLQPTLLSCAESLEQLTWIEEGFRINVLNLPDLPISINSPADLDEFRKIIK